MKYNIITFGCQMNKNDSERISAALEKEKYQPSTLEEADLVVVNMCSIRQSAVDRVLGKKQIFEKIKSKNPHFKTLLTGCILREDYKKFKEYFDYIIPKHFLPKWKKYLGKDKYHFLPNMRQTGNRLLDFLEIKPKYKNDFSAFIPISTGCNNFCTYCVVPYTRGPLVCRSHKKIIAEVQSAVRNGCKEIWLLGQNVNDYRSPDNKKIQFSELLTMVNKINGDFWIRFTSPHPKDFSEKLIEAMAKSKKFAEYINVPGRGENFDI